MGIDFLIKLVGCERRQRKTAIAGCSPSTQTIRFYPFNIRLASRTETKSLSRRSVIFSTSSAFDSSDMDLFGCGSLAKNQTYFLLCTMNLFLFPPY